MKRKNASISNADILYNYVHNNCPRRFFIDFYGVSSILSTLFMLCGQIVDKLSSVDKFIIFSIFNNSLFYKGLRGYLPQQFLYFLPLPQAPFLSILSLYLVHIVLWLLALFYGHLVHIIISIICIINITNNLFNVDKMWTKSSYILSFVSKEIISYIDCLINVGKK